MITRHAHAPKIVPIGRRAGSKAVPKECYAGIRLLSVLFDWPHYDIGRLFGVAPSTIGKICSIWERA
jgi:hypothetical protein